jgi:hypothetical protein
MSTPVKLASALPDGDRNGLSTLVGALTDNPRGMYVVLGIVNCKKIETNPDTGEVIPTARFLRLEALLPEDKPVADKLIRRALEKRTGLTVLPMELEDDLTAAFEDADDETGA